MSEAAATEPAPGLSTLEELAAEHNALVEAGNREVARFTAVIRRALAAGELGDLAAWQAISRVGDRQLEERRHADLFAAAIEAERDGRRIAAFGEIRQAVLDGAGPEPAVRRKSRIRAEGRHLRTAGGPALVPA